MGFPHGMESRRIAIWLSVLPALTIFFILVGGFYILIRGMSLLRRVLRRFPGEANDEVGFVYQSFRGNVVSPAVQLI